MVITITFGLLTAHQITYKRMGNPKVSSEMTRIVRNTIQSNLLGAVICAVSVVRPIKIQPSRKRSFIGATVKMARARAMPCASAA